MVLAIIDAYSVMKSVSFNVRNLDRTWSFNFFNTIGSSIKAINQEVGQVSMAIICWEGSPAKRSVDNPAYKANRIPSKNKFHECVERVKELAPYLGFHQAYNPEWEGDDVVAQFAFENVQKVIISGDGDMKQLVSSTTRIYNTTTRAKERWTTLENLLSQTGYSTPEEFLMAKVVCGDGSDGLPGCQDVGNGSFQAYLRGMKLAPARKKKIEDYLNSEEYLLNFNITRLPHPDYEAKKTIITNPTKDYDKSLNLLNEFQFASIVKRFPEYWETFKGIKS